MTDVTACTEEGRSGGWCVVECGHVRCAMSGSGVGCIVATRDVPLGTPETTVIGGEGT